MSDIPVGSPPVPPGRHAAPSGWYPDPTDQRQQRYWDGWQWARNIRAADGYGQPPQQGPGGYPQDSASGNGYPPQQSPGGYAPEQNPGSGYGYPPQQGPIGNQYPPQQGYPYAPQPGSYPAVPGAKAMATADGVPLAGWWYRVLASLIDGLIIGVIAGIPGIPIYARMVAGLTTYLRQVTEAAQLGLPSPPTPSAGDFLTAGDQLVLAAISLIIGLLYHVLFLRWKSATPGKLACRLRVVPVDRGRSTDRLGWSTILIRTAVWVIPGLASTLPGVFSFFLGIVRLVDVLFPLWQPKRQALHDLAAKTQVVKIG